MLAVNKMKVKNKKRKNETRSSSNNFYLYVLYFQIIKRKLEEINY
jgi:hypothetical protein